MGADTSTEPAGRSGRSAALTAKPVVAVTTALVVFAGVVVLAAAAAAGGLDGVPLLSPAVAAAIELLAGTVLGCSWLSRQRRWLRLGLPLVVLTAATVTGATAAALWVTGMVTDAYPASFALWVGLAVAALLGAPYMIINGHRGTGPARLRRWAAAAAVPLTLSGAFLLINDEYGAWPTLGDLLDHTHIVGASTLHLAGPPHTGAGVLAALDPPATTSHFAHQPGQVYLPPAYFTPQRATLPVIVMLAGTPGGPTQWPTAGRAIQTADTYAASHHGRGPIMVFVDQNGSPTSDTECVDGPRGNAETYLTVDVKNFVSRTLGVVPDPDRWAVVGFSEGGTCAFDLALAHPSIYRHFVDLAGDDRPTLGSPHRTLVGLFGGSMVALRDHDPVRLLATRRYRNTTGWFAAGVHDERHILGARKLAMEAGRAGLTVHEFTGPAGHNWQFAGAAFARVLPSLCVDLSLR